MTTGKMKRRMSTGMKRKMRRSLMMRPPHA
jgi:hypothetical protein